MPTIWRYILLSLIASVLLVFLAAFSLADGKLHIVFCDVGQGDAALIYRGSTQILIDGGPDNSVLSCLSRHMPFWDRKLEIVTMTHPQEDHYGGLIDVVRRYDIGLFAAPGVDNDTAGFRTLEREIEDKRVKVMSLASGDILRNGMLQIETIWPSGEWLAGDEGYGGNKGDEGKVLGLFTTARDLNEFSLVQKISYGGFDALFTGDIEPPVTDIVAGDLPAFAGSYGGVKEAVEVLKVPHHGSKNGLTRGLLEATRPKIAVISVGKKNRYGHPHKEALRIIGEMGDIRVLRTDLDGEVEIVTDGKNWKLLK